jgi:hypothetical protein
MLEFRRACAREALENVAKPTELVLSGILRSGLGVRFNKRIRRCSTNA